MMEGAEPISTSEYRDKRPVGVDGRYRVFVDLSPDAVHLVALDGTILMANQLDAELHGFATADDMLGRNALELLAPEERGRAVQNFRQRAHDDHRVHHNEYMVLRIDGTRVPVEIGTSVLRSESGDSQAYLIVLRDVTERRRAEVALRESEEQHRQMFVRNRAIKMLVDPESGRIVDANPAACAFYGYTLPDLKTRTILDISMLPADVYDADAREVADLRRSYMLRQHRLASGAIRDVEVYTCPVDVRGKMLFYSIIHDITERKRTEEALVHQALHDSLTDLPNRTLLRQRLQNALIEAQETGSHVGLLFLDLDHFKEVNDTLGHHAGDVLLQDLAVRLRTAIGEADTAARLGGDEFAILLPETDHAGASRLARKISAVLDQPLEIEGKLFHLGVSIGIAVSPEHATDATGLMSRADVAMYAAKRARVNHVMYAPEHDIDSPARLALLRYLRAALENNGLLLHYQPQVKLRNGGAKHVEALVRCVGEEGLIEPEVFIELAEESGLIKPLTTWVLNEATRQSAAWQAAGHDVSVAVNLSARTLHDPQLVKIVARALDRSGVSPESLELEITETAIVVDPKGALDTVAQLHAMGIQIAIDDFGTGYTSLAHMRQLPVDNIKIDRSFVLEMRHSVDDAFIVRSIIDLAHNLGLGVIAEGVEDRETLEMLAEMGCNMAQGFYFSRPVSAEAFQTWLITEGAMRSEL